MSSDEDHNALFERLLERSGGFGRFQKLFLILCIFAGIVAAFNHLSAIYFTFSPDFVCLSHYNETNNNTNTDNNELVITERIVFDSECGSGCDEVSFDESVMVVTLVTIHNLVCDRKLLLPFVTGSYMLGVVMFSLVSGMLSDKYGRRSTLVFLATLNLISSALSLLTFNSFWLLLSCRLVVGGSVHSTWAVLFIISMEMTMANKRALVSGLINSGWNVGAIILALLAFFTRDAYILQIVFSLLALLIVLLLPLVPESPRWLVQNKRNNEALNIYMRMASFNNMDNIDISHTFDALIELEEHKKNKNDNNNDNLNNSLLRQQFSFLVGYGAYPEVRRRFLLLLLPFLAVGTSSYGIHFTTKLVQGDLFTTAVLKEAFTLTWILLLINIYRRVRRTTCLLLMFMVSGLLAMLFFVLSSEMADFVPVVIKTLVFGVTQAMITGNYYLVDTYVPEVFSTDSRNLFFSLLETISKMGTVLAPFIVDWGGSIHPGLPAFIFGTMMAMASLAFLFSPETKGQPLKQTVDELKSEQDSIAHRLLARN